MQSGSEARGSAPSRVCPAILEVAHSSRTFQCTPYAVVAERALSGALLMTASRPLRLAIAQLRLCFLLSTHFRLGRTFVTGRFTLLYIVRMPGTPKKKLSQHQRELAKVKAARKSPKTHYLVVYNALSALGWAYVLYRLVSHLATGTGDVGVKGLLGLEGQGEKLLGRARTGYSE